MNQAVVVQATRGQTLNTSDLATSEAASAAALFDLVSGGNNPI